MLSVREVTVQRGVPRGPQIWETHLEEGFCLTHYFLDLQHNIYKFCKCCVNVVGKGRTGSKRGRKGTRKGKTQTENKEERQKWEDKKGRNLKE